MFVMSPQRCRQRQSFCQPDRIFSTS